MVLSAICLVIGAVLLRFFSLVPLYLTETTIIAVFAILIVAHFVRKGYTLAANVGLVLALLSIIVSAVSPGHDAAILKIFTDPVLTVLDVLEIMGFYLFPLAFIVLRLAKNESFSRKKFR